MPRPVVLHDVDGYSVIAKLTIEKISLELPVIGETTDEALKVAPCLFSGPATPADNGNMVVTGHNKKDGSQFGRLDELEEGDTVTLMDKWGDTFSYEVYDIETITPDNVAELEEYEGERALAASVQDDVIWIGWAESNRPLLFNGSIFAYGEKVANCMYKLDTLW